MSRRASRRKVLYLVDTLEVGGTERSLLEIASRLERFEPLVVQVYEGAALAPLFEQRGIRTRSLGMTVRYGFLTAGWRLGRLLTEERPALVHSMLFRSGIVARWPWLLAKAVPVVHSLVSEPLASPLRRAEPRPWVRRAFQALEALTAPRVAGFLANSATVAEAHARALGIPRERFRVVYRGRDPAGLVGLDAAGVRALREELGLAEGEAVVLNVARLRPAKRQEDLLRALPRVLERHPRCRLLIAGEGPLHAELEALARGLGVAGAVRFLGQRKDVASLLAIADVFAFPSAFEGHPGALVEAMLTARAIVASDIPVHRETLEDGTTALLAPVAEPEALAAAVGDLLDDRERARRLGEAARRAALERFHVDRVAEAHEAFYDEVLERT